MAQRPRALDPTASPQARFGADLRAWRARRGLSQARLGALVHVSGDLVGKIEKAERLVQPELVSRFDEVLAAGGALVDSATSLSRSAARRDRIGPNGADGSPPQPRHARSSATVSESAPPGVTALRDSVLSSYASDTSAGANFPDATPAVRVLLPRLWSLYQSSRFGEAAELAAATLVLIPRSSALPAGFQGVAPASMVCHAAAAIATKLGAGDVAWVCVERGLALAEKSDDQRVVASLLRSVAHVTLSTGDAEGAYDVVSRSLDRFGQEAEPSPVWLSLLGSLHLVGAMSASRASGSRESRRHLAEASSLAELLRADGNHWWTAFGPSNVASHRVSISLELGDYQAAAQAASSLDLRHLPVERQIRLCLEKARLSTWLGDDRQAVGLVVHADRLAPDHVRHHYITRELAARWARRPVASEPEVTEMLALLQEVEC